MWKNWKKYNTNWMQRVFTFKGKVLPIQQHITSFTLKSNILSCQFASYFFKWVASSMQTLSNYSNLLTTKTNKMGFWCSTLFATLPTNQEYKASLRDQRLPRGFWTVFENMLFYRRELRVHSVIFPFLINKNPHVFVDMFLTSFHLSR